MTVYTSSHTKLVSKLAKLYEDGQVSETTARTLNKVLDFEMNQIQTDLAATEKDLSEFEYRYHMSTADFFQQWKAGQTDDRMDYVEWASLAQMADNLRKRLEFLTSEPRK
ncbi:MAG: hypothetical protein ACOYY3_05555 [Chloroflexota bacterium]